MHLSEDLRLFVVHNHLTCFSPSELQLIVCGSPDLDFLELAKGATYENGFTKDDPTIKWLWEIVHEYSLEQKKEIIIFFHWIRQSSYWGLRKNGIHHYETW